VAPSPACLVEPFHAFPAVPAPRVAPPVLCGPARISVQAWREAARVIHDRINGNRIRATRNGKVYLADP